MTVRSTNSFGDRDNDRRASFCRIAPANAARADRNYQIAADFADDPADPTDFTTPVPDADYSKIAKRVRETNIGPRAYDAMFRGEGVE